MTIEDGFRSRQEGKIESFEYMIWEIATYFGRAWNLARDLKIIDKLGVLEAIEVGVNLVELQERQT
jgi:hypothetical protein